MYRPKKYIKLDPLPSIPGISDCRRLLKEGEKSKGCLVELPFRSQKTNSVYSLTVKVELGGTEPVWTLYEGESNKSRVVWSSPFEDIDLMNDVLQLSLPGDTLSALRDAGLSQPQNTVPAELVARPQAQESFHDSTRPNEGPALHPGSQFSSGQEHQVSLPDIPAPRITPVLARESVKQPVKPAEREAQEPDAPAPVQALPPAYNYPAPPNYGYPPGYYNTGGYPAYPYPAPGGYYPTDPNLMRAQSLPVRSTPGALDRLPLERTPFDQEPLRQRPNVHLGQFLTEASLIPNSTLQAALRLQDMVRSGALKTSQAAEAVRRAHSRGGAIDNSYFSAEPVSPGASVRVAPPLGTILVEAGLISAVALKSALNLQDVVRSGSMSREDALAVFVKEHFGVEENVEKNSEREAEQAIDLLKEAGLLSEKNVEAARAVKQRHGGNIAKILAAAGKVDMKTFECAVTCRQLMKAQRLKLEQVMIVLNFCQRSRVTFEEAIDELGWDQP